MNWATSLAMLMMGFALLSAVQTRAQQPQPSAAVAQVDITPPMGMPMAGYYHPRGADGVLDPLYCKALVIEVGGMRAALVSLDLISVTRAITDQARTDIEAATGIPADHVLISATHAHTGPELARDSLRVDDMGGSNQETVTYTQELPRKIQDCVQKACDALQPVQIEMAKGLCHDLAFNRRYFMRDGSVGWNPGKLNPDIMLPAGPTDPEVGILYVQQPAATSPVQGVATYVNFAMHPDTTGGTKFSADWPGALGRLLASYHGPQHLTLVGNGTCGNINNYDFSWKWPNGGPFEQNRIAAILGASVLQAYKHLQPVSVAPLAVRSTRVELALPPVTEQQVAEAKETLKATTDDRGANFMKLVRAYRTLDVAHRQGKPFRVEVQAISLGPDVAWVGLPGEVFVELGLALEETLSLPTDPGGRAGQREYRLHPGSPQLRRRQLRTGKRPLRCRFR